MLISARNTSPSLYGDRREYTQGSEPQFCHNADQAIYLQNSQAHIFKHIRFMGGKSRPNSESAIIRRGFVCLLAGRFPTVSESLPMA